MRYLSIWGNNPCTAMTLGFEHANRDNFKASYWQRPNVT